MPSQLWQKKGKEGESGQEQEQGWGQEEGGRGQEEEEGNWWQEDGQARKQEGLDMGKLYLYDVVNSVMF